MAELPGAAPSAAEISNGSGESEYKRLDGHKQYDVKKLGLVGLNIRPAASCADGKPAHYWSTHDDQSDIDQNGERFIIFENHFL